MWTDTLPVQLKARISALVRAQPSSEAILNELYEHLSLGPPTKKKKLAPPPAEPEKPVLSDASQPTQVEVLDEYNLRITSPVNASEVICELSGLSFISPTRKKFNLLFHLFIGADGVPQPVLSVVNMATNIPEISVRGLLESVKLCILLPVLGNTTVSTKKDTGMLCFWLNDEATSNKDKNEPIICALNLDAVRKQLAKDGKIHPNAAEQVAHIEQTDEGIKPVNGLILEFLERQFGLCGIQLVNFMPSSIPSKNQFILNSDNGVSISRLANGVSDLVSVDAYRGSKEGALLFFSSADQTSSMVFGFKKPIMIVDFSSIRDVSYKDITKFTFTMVVTMQKGDSETTIEFSMIDQKFFLEIDEFIRARNIEDNSYDVKHKEKSKDEKLNDATAAADKQDLGLAAIAVSDDDEEEDGSYTGGVEGESDSDIAEEFGSNVESEDDDDPTDDETKPLASFKEDD